MGRSHRGGLIGFLDSIGYREDTLTWQEQIAPEKDLSDKYPYCAAPECSPKDRMAFKRAHFEKPWCRRCQDCGSALVWMGKPKSREERKLKIEVCQHVFDVEKSCAFCGVDASDWGKGWDAW